MDVQFQNANILIVDDEYSNVLLLKRTFEQAGITHIKGVTDPAQVTNLIDSFRPDILLLDLNMPGLDGFGVMKLVEAAIAPDSFLPILVLTADISQETKRKALAAGANDYLTKPFDLFEVILRTRNLLRTRFLQNELVAQNAALEEKVSERTHELEAAHREAIERLGKACEASDDDSGEHTKRVGALSAQIARALGMPEKEAEMIHLAAQLHDIGKTGIPSGILTKPGKLTEEEYRIVKRHTVIGGTILAGSKAPLLKLAEDIAMTHHEWWSGQGYPRGLCGEQIPRAGRIVAVSDVFDALTHERPYKHAWSVPDAVAEIQRLNGKQFDPQIVDALLEILSDAGLGATPFVPGQYSTRHKAPDAWLHPALRSELSNCLQL